jgi:hypothetical protein
VAIFREVPFIIPSCLSASLPFCFNLPDIYRSGLLFTFFTSVARSCFLYCPCLFLCLYSTTPTTQTSMPSAGLEPAITGSDRSQTLCLDNSATGTGVSLSPYQN